MKAWCCYLCGNTLLPQEASADHVVPKTLIERQQPRVKGFDYAGTLPSHRACNNQFGPETYAIKALHLIAALYDDACVFEYAHPTLANAPMMAIKSTCLPGFTRRDFAFFKIIDARNLSRDAMHDADLLHGRQPVNPKQLALFTALAVLTKSAAALLVSRQLPNVPTRWDVLAVPYVGDASGVDFDDVLGATVPFDTEVKAWIGPMVTGDYLVVYRAKRVVVYFLFRFSPSPAAYDRMLSQFDDGNRFRFEGGSLMDLVNGVWTEV